MDLILEDDAGNEKPVKHQQRRISTAIRDRICLAYIMQESLVALARGDGLLKVIFAAYVAVQYLELGLLTKRDVIQQYCTCVSSHDHLFTFISFRCHNYAYSHYDRAINISIHFARFGNIEPRMLCGGQRKRYC
jgi:hypothetical protein